MSSVLNLFVPNSTVLNQPMFEIFELREDGEIGIAAIAEPFFRLCDNPELADWIIIPLFSSSLTSENGLRFIRETFQLSQKLRKPLGIFSNSDIIVDPKVNPITIFTPGAYASMKNQVELPALLPYDPVEKWKNSTWESIEYSGFIKIGFCGQATRNPLKFLKDLYTIENLRFKKKKRKSPFLYIPRFLPAFERGRLLRSLENSKILQTDFLLRSHYKAGAITKEEKDKVEKEFYSNIDSNLFTLCLRGMGNYSVRFYQTLAMGRIPVLIDTDSKLPFENRIPYEELIVRIPFQDRFNTEAYLLKFLKGKSS
ncbi:exostosin family protein, partial [Algoriphagus sp.]|uniref:exostosin domain-containing protein n=1 Tax=Algoriphagus sp. TaxID=1872435 RepID=UPI0025DC1E94